MPSPTLIPGAPCWIDLYSSNTDAATTFYGRLLGWSAESPEEGFGGYFTFTKDGKFVAGCMANDGTTGAPDTWTVYLTTDDVEATAKAAAEHGGQVYVAPMQVGENGSFAMLGDSGNAGIGAWQAGKIKGFDVRNEVGTPTWFELHTRDYAGAVAFYRDVFGWEPRTMSDTPEFRYTTLGEGDDALAGIMDDTSSAPEGSPAGWSVYFRVDDTDAALERVVELGGTVVDPAVDTPYGRLAQAADPTGVVFRLVAN